MDLTSDCINVEDLTKEHLISAATTGRYWLVKKCEQSGIPLDIDNNRPLERAVYNGRTSIVEYLLDNGCDPNAHEVLRTACQKGYTRISSILLKCGGIKDNILQNAFLDAVQNGNTGCVRLLLEHNVDVHMDYDLPLLEACRNRHSNIVSLLIEAGAYVDCRNGQPLIECAKSNLTDVIETLIEHGADVTINDNEPLRTAAKARHILVIITLLNNGADASILQDIDLDDTFKAVIHAFTRKGVTVRLRKAIHESLSKQDFKWQILCSSRNPDLSALRKQTTLHGIPTTTDDTKYTMCAKLATNYEKDLANKGSYEEHMTDFSGTPINDLPHWKVMTIDNIPFNCFDLFTMIRHGNTTNPYTRTPLPVEKILEHRNHLQSILASYRFKNVNLLESVATQPILTEKMMLRNMLENEVWDKLAYTPSLSLVMDASDEVIDEMIDKLSIICKRKSIFEIISPGTDIYPMLRSSDIFQIKDAQDLYKKKVFIQLLSKMVNMDDEHRDTRRVSISIMLKTFANNNNGEDDFTFMLGNGSTDTDDDLDINALWWDDDS